MNRTRIPCAVFLALVLGSNAMAQIIFAPPPPPSGENPQVPFVISFVPMISFPFGCFDVNFSAAAIGAVARNVHGFMGAGVFNIAEDIYGFQGAGVFNISGDVHGVQGAGVFDLSDDVYGFQGAGVFNVAGDVNGFQGAGVFNMADDVNGTQAAGVFNVAGKLHGVQIGLVNIADEVEGFQLGLINIARYGVNGPGAAFEPQTGYAWAWWQNGSRHLYSVIGAGLPAADLSGSAERLVASVGLGSRFGRNDGLHMDLEIAAAQEIGPRLDEFGRLFWDCDASIIPLLALYPEIRLRAGLR